MFCCCVAGDDPFLCIKLFWVKIRKINIMKAKISLGFYACVTYGTMNGRKKTRKREINIEREIPAGVIILTD